MTVSSKRFALVNADGVVADLDLPATAYRALLKMRSLSEAGGRIEIDQADLAQRLDISRPAVTAALRHLDLAQLVKKQRNGVYQLNPMLAGYLSLADCTAAVADMEPAERLNAPDFVERYHEAVKMYQDQLAQKRQARDQQKKVVAARRGALHAVG
ncbi:MarR family transcriptional regulator [Streptomyces sp. NPDC048409]|uniref:MarR family transcriptional regulator n=1 Tax=Streptomyces sp. NPDC048409 TaxID=3154723 RepID=UPI00341F3928